MWQSQVLLIGLTLLAAAPSHQPEADNRDPAALIIPSGVGRADAADHGLSTGEKTGIGAAAGGLIGLIAGGGSGLLKGALVGAGGGLAWGLLDKGGRRVEQGSTLAFTLIDPIRIY
jgi:hypothetical protein